MKWAKGIVEWFDGEDAYISVVFSWHADDAWTRASWLHHAGYRVHVGGPGIFRRGDVVKAMRDIGIEHIGGKFDDAVVRHNPSATFASRGCPQKCSFCIVPKLEGNEFTLIDDFPVRPVLCDNNLSELPEDFQDHIVSRYRKAGVMIADANSGFEPSAFTEDTYRRWKPIMKGPWRFAYDDQGDGPGVESMLGILAEVTNSRRKMVYVLIGNEPFAECMDRIYRVIAWGGEPYVQPVMKINAKTKRPWVRFDWTERLLTDVARWANRHLWKYGTFDEYDRSIRTGRRAPAEGTPSMI